MTEVAKPSGFTLNAPGVVPGPSSGEEAAVAIKEMAGPLSPEEQKKVETKALTLVDTVSGIDPRDPAFQKAAEEITTWGAEATQKTSQVSNRILERPATEASEYSAQTRVAKTLGDLRVQITDLDPNRADLTGAKRVLKWLPGGNKIDAYFNRYRSAQSHLDAIEKALISGQDELRKDSAALALEQENLWSGMVELRKVDASLAVVEETVKARIEQANASGNKDLADALGRELLFYVGQRREDLLTHAAVNAQGLLSMNLIQQNNKELIRGVDRARETTMSALRVAIIVSGALAQQKLVLDQIEGLNATTSAMIESTARMLQTQGAAINKQASEATINREALENAFDSIFETFAALDSFRDEANKNRDISVQALKGQLDRASGHLSRVGGANGFEGAVTDRQAEQIEAGAPAAIESSQRKMPWD